MNDRTYPHQTKLGILDSYIWYHPTSIRLQHFTIVHHGVIASVWVVCWGVRFSFDNAITVWLIITMSTTWTDHCLLVALGLLLAQNCVCEYMCLSPIMHVSIDVHANYKGALYLLYWRLGFLKCFPVVVNEAWHWTYIIIAWLYAACNKRSMAKVCDL